METKDILKQLREKNNYSIKDVANGTKMQYTMCREYESGDRRLGMSAAIKFADFYGVTIDYLLGRPEATPPVDALAQLSKDKAMSTLEEELLRKYMDLPHEARRAVVQFINDATITARQRQAGVHGNTYVLRAASRSNHDQPVTNVTLTADELADLQNSPDVDPDL